MKMIEKVFDKIFNENSLKNEINPNLKRYEK